MKLISLIPLAFFTALSIALLWFAGMCGIASYYTHFPEFALIAAVLCVASVMGSLASIVCAIETL